MAAKRTTNKRYSDEFKADAVALLRRSGRPIAEVARELGITDTSLGSWARDAARNDTPEQVAAAAQEAKDVARLRKRVRELEQEIEILKRFTAYWVRSEGQQ
ncbi:MAG: transposase [Actinomycetota bacterium]|nr:transposase [Actinomycetota bacterium]